MLLAYSSMQTIFVDLVLSSILRVAFDEIELRNKAFLKELLVHILANDSHISSNPNHFSLLEHSHWE